MATRGDNKTDNCSNNKAKPNPQPKNPQNNSVGKNPPRPEVGAENQEKLDGERSLRSVRQPQQKQDVQEDKSVTIEPVKDVPMDITEDIQPIHHNLTDAVFLKDELDKSLEEA